MKKAALIVIAILLVFLLLFPVDAAQACMSGACVFVRCVLPSLLPFMIAAGTFCRLAADSAFLGRFSPLMESLFRLPGTAVIPFLSGLLCGNPVAAQQTAQLCRDGRLTPRQAGHCAAVSSFVSPGFLFGTIGALVSPQTNALFPIAAGHYLGAFLTGIILCRLPKRKSENSLIKKEPSMRVRSLSPMQAFADSAAAASRALPMIGVLLCFFAVVQQMIEKTGRISSGTLSTAALYAALELSGGCAALFTVPVALPLRNGLLSAALSFGGLCIFCQNALFLQPCDVRMRPLFSARILHALIAFAIAFALSLLLV